MNLVLLANLAATLFLTGLAWFLQVVHLPLMLRFDGPDFAAYAKSQRTRNTALMAPAMVTELITAAILVYDFAPVGSHRNMFHLALLVLIIWIVTFASIIPLHSRLIRGFDAATVQTLIRRNWIRTGCWTLRATFLMWTIATFRLPIR